MKYVPFLTPTFFKDTKSEQERFDKLCNAAKIDGKIMYIGRLAQRAAFLAPDKIALQCKDQTITFKELYQRSIAISNLLKKMGVQPRDRVLLLWENSIEFYIGYFAILQMGAVVAPLNVFLQEKEILHIINDSQPVALIISDELRERLATVTDAQLPPLIKQSDISLEKPVPQEVEDFTITDLEPDEMAALLYTSGTTGFPKGVMTSSKNIITNVMQGIARLGIGVDENERLFAVLPLFHSFAQFTCVWGAFLSCSTVIVVQKIDRRNLLDGLRQGPTIFFGVPALYGLLSLFRTAPLETVKYFVSGGDALPDKIRAGFALIYGRKIISGYGLTETTPLVAAQLEDVAVRTDTVGKLVVGMQARLLDETNADAPHGSIGELWVKGDNVMLGYYNAALATEAVLKDGWFATGDLAYFDKENRLVITGRSKDLIVNKGIKIYPQEVENVLMGHPLVIRVGVIGMGENKAEQVPVAYVQVKEVSPNIEKELQKLASKSLAGYKVPRSFIITSKNLPTTATGKVDKKRLSDLDITSGK